MACGFTTPEEVLCAVDSNEDEDDYDDIIIRWIRGADDSNVKMALSGTATQHLQTIYELRALLGLPISSRGRIPLYPISTNPRLKQYWEANYRLRRPAPIDSAGQQSDRQIPSLLTLGSGHSCSSHPQHASPASRKPPEGQTTRARSVEIFHKALPTPTRATRLQQEPGAPGVSTNHILPARPSSGDTTVPRLPTDTIDQQQASFQSTASPVSTFISSASTSSMSVPSIPLAALAWGLQSSPSPILTSQGYGILQHNWIHPSPRNSTVGHPPSSVAPHQQRVRNGVTNSSQDTVITDCRAIAPLDLPYKSPYPTSATRDGLQHASPVVVPSELPLAGNQVQRHVAAPYNADTTPVSTFSSPAADAQSSFLVGSTAPAAFSPNDSDIDVPISPNKPRNATPTTPPGKSQELFFDSLSSSVAPQLSSPHPHIEDAPIGEPSAREETAESAPDRPILPGCAIRLSPDNEPSLRQKTGTLDIRFLDTDDKSARAEAKMTETIPEPWCTYMKGLKELPCMDCGEDDGHLWGCHLGSKCYNDSS